MVKSKKSTAVSVETGQVSTCDPTQVSKGSFWSRHSFGEVTQSKVLGVGQDHTMEIKNEKGDHWYIGADIVSREFCFADQFNTEESINRTRAIEVLAENPFTAMTITFRKKADHKTVAKEVASGQGNMTDRQWSIKLKGLMGGEERTMIGYHRNSHDEHGRLQFHENGVGPRVVDPRTVDTIITRNVKYTVKK